MTMKRITGLVCGALLAWSAMTVAAAEPAVPAAPGVKVSQNAALQYWLAFSVLPSDKKSLDLLAAWRTTPLDVSVAQVIQPTALRLLRRGAGMAETDWGLDYVEDGPNTVLPYLSKARKLTEMACLDARLRFQSGDVAGAMDDAFAALRLSHGVGTGGALICTLVEYALNGVTDQLFANEMGRLKPEELATLRRRWAQFPAPTDLSSSLERDRISMVGWAMNRINRGETKRMNTLLAGLGVKVAGNDAAEMKKAWSELDRQYQRAVEIAKLPWPEFQKAETEFEKQVKSDTDPLARILMPAIGRAKFVECRVIAERAMVDAGAAYLHGGEAEFRTVRDPFGDGPFVMKKTAKGFELSSGLADKGKAVMLEFVVAAVRK